MTTPPPTRTIHRPFDLRRATGALLLLSGSAALGLTTFWLGSGSAATTTGAASTGAATADASTWAGADDQVWDSGQDDGWTQAAPQSGYSSQPRQAARGWSRGS